MRSIPKQHTTFCIHIHEWQYVLNRTKEDRNDKMRMDAAKVRQMVSKMLQLATALQSILRTKRSNKTLPLMNANL